MLSKRKTTANIVTDIDSVEGMNYMKAGSLLEAQGEFCMSRFNEHKDELSSCSETKNSKTSVKLRLKPSRLPSKRIWAKVLFKAGDK